MSNKTSDKNVENIETVIKDCREHLKLYGEAFITADELDRIEKILAEREQMLKTINTVEKEKGEWIKAYQEEKDKQFNILINSIPKQKIKEILDKAEVMDYYTLPNVIEDLEKLLEEK